VRWFPALVSNHVVDLLKRYDAQDLPQTLTDYIKARDHYDYQDHVKRGAAHADFVPNDVIDRFCVIGTVEQSRRRIEELVEVGVHQFNLYLMVDKPENVIKKYGEAIIPAFN
jgi:alkanesulfonate monooxygenase SsuD/methylene tetrahydromethanopterin reductase-like flavin-dependent oxidoreductase (luciferase family)